LKRNTNMEIEHESHLSDIRANATDDIDYKYQKGQEEHQGKLWEMPARQLGIEIKNEAVDLYVYMHCLNEKLIRIENWVTIGLKESVPDYALRGILQEIKSHLVK